MMSIEAKSTLNGMRIEQSCAFCGGTGKIYIYRHDLEDFDEIEWKVCKKT